MEKAELVDRAELEYETAGSGEPVVFIHGAFIADAFKPLQKEPSLALRHQLIRYHRRGYMGSSRTTDPVGVPRHAADCAELLRHLGVQRAHVVGHSYGATVALRLASDHPDVVHSLALLEPALMAGRSLEDYRASLQRSRERYIEAGASVAVAEFLEKRWPGYRNVLDRSLPGAFSQAVQDAETWYEREMLGLLTSKFDRADALRVRQPTLCVLGGNSEALWARFGETHRLLLSWLPHCSEYVLPSTTHFLLIEDPRKLAAALATFWAQHPFAGDVM